MRLAGMMASGTPGGCRPLLDKQKPWERRVSQFVPFFLLVPPLARRGQAASTGNRKLCSSGVPQALKRFICSCVELRSLFLTLTLFASGWLPLE